MISVFSDLHGNDAALLEALPQMQSRRFCLGDIVGYRKNPRRSVELVRESAELVVQGNHDAAAVGQFDDFLEMIPSWLGDTLREVESLPADLFEWLAALPRITADDPWTLVHGSLRDPWMEFLVPEVAENHFQLQKTDFSLVGHTHHPLALSEEGDVFVPGPKSPELDISGKRWILNPGSLGVISAGQSWMDVCNESARWHWL